VTQSVIYRMLSSTTTGKLSDEAQMIDAGKAGCTDSRSGPFSATARPGTKKQMCRSRDRKDERLKKKSCLRYRTRVNTFRLDWLFHDRLGICDARWEQTPTSAMADYRWTSETSVIGGAKTAANLASHCPAEPLLGGYRKAKI
jgi:hypothetical protein